MARRHRWDRTGEVRWSGRIYRTNGRVWNIDANQTYNGTQNGVSQGDGDRRTSTGEVLYLVYINLSSATFAASAPATGLYAWGKGIAATESTTVVAGAFKTTSLVARGGTVYNSTFGPIAASSISKPSTLDVLTPVNAPTFAQFPYSNFKKIHATGSNTTLKIAGPATTADLYSNVGYAGVRPHNRDGSNVTNGSLEWYMTGGTHGVRTWGWSNWANAPVSWPATGGALDIINIGFGQRTGMNWTKVSDVLIISIASFNETVSGPLNTDWLSNADDSPSAGDIGSTGWVVAKVTNTQPIGTRPAFTDGEVVYLSNVT